MIIRWRNRCGPLRRRLLGLLLLAGLVPAASAQVQLSGTADIGIGYGGRASSYPVNGIAADYRRPHLEISEFNLFLSAEAGSDFFLNGRIVFDTKGTGRLNPPRLALASLDWEPEGSRLRASVGRFLSPLGLYPRRQLAADNSVTAVPLLYGYVVNISDTYGYWPYAGEQTGSYGSGDAGVTTFNAAGYATGAMIDWTMVPERAGLQIALVNAAPASPADYTNLPNVGLLAHLDLQPVIFWRQGLGVGYGGLMQRSAANAAFDCLERFSQAVLSTDFVLGYSYFELSGEVARAWWRVPAAVRQDFVVDADSALVPYRLTSWGGYVDIKYEPPFVPGGFVALRLERLAFDRLNESYGGNSYAPGNWDNSVNRYTIGVGYHLTPSVLVKAGYSDQKIAGKLAFGKAFAARAVITVGF